MESELAFRFASRWNAWRQTSSQSEERFGRGPSAGEDELPPDSLVQAEVEAMRILQIDVP